MGKRLAVALAILGLLGAWVAPADAVPVNLVNWDSVVLPGAPILGPTPTSFVSGGGLEVAQLTYSVWHTGTAFLYQLTINPAPPSPDIPLHDISLVSTGFDVIGFTGTAGYSFSNAMSAGAPGPGDTAFFISHSNTTGRINFAVSDGIIDNNIPFWDAPPRLVPITLFFESAAGPGGLGVYSIINSPAGEAMATVPGPVVPEPVSLLLLGSGLVGLGYWGRSRVKRG